VQLLQLQFRECKQPFVTSYVGLYGVSTPILTDSSSLPRLLLQLHSGMDGSINKPRALKAYSSFTLLRLYAAVCLIFYSLRATFLT